MDVQLKPLYQLPVPSTSFDGGGAFMLLGTIRYNYERDGIDYRSGIKFNKRYASMEHGENTSQVWQIDAYDTLVEIQNSPWVEALQAETADLQRRFGEQWEMHHYMIYLDSSGTFEVIAESWRIFPEEIGSWPNPLTIWRDNPGT